MTSTGSGVPRPTPAHCWLFPLFVLAGFLPAQETPALADVVWSYIEAPTKVAARSIEKDLRGRADLTPAALDAILDAGPRRAVPKAGVRAGLRFTIPGVKQPTTYTLGIPAGLESGKRYPLWIAIHGTGGTARWAFRDIWRFLEPHKVLCVAPTEARDIHGKGWGYRHRERALHMGLVDELLKTLPIDQSRVYVSGLSRGGHASFDLALRYSDRVAGGMPIIGSVQQRDRPLLVNAHDVRLHVMNGLKDQPSLVEGATIAVDRLKALGYPTTAVFDPDRGHGSFADHYEATVAELLKSPRPTAPARMAFAVRDLAYGRHYWVSVKGLHKDAYKPGEPIRIAGVSKMSAAERARAYLKHLEDRTPRLELKIENNRIDVSARLVTRFELFVPESAIDLARPLDVWVQGKRRVRSRKLKRPSPLRRLQLMRAFGTTDPAFRFVNKLPLTAR